MTTLCPHFGTCGGCRHQDMPYPDQLAQKTAQLREWFAPWWQAPIAITPSPELWHYRNKLEFNFDRMRYEEPPPPGFVRETVIGFRRPGRWYWTLDIEDCRIAPTGIPALLSGVRGWYRQQGLKSWFARDKDGTLRYLVVRETKRRAERLVLLITHDAPIDRESFVAAVQAVYPAHAIYHGIYRGAADNAAADELHLLAGAPTIAETLHIDRDAGPPLALDFQISPFAFFQTNSLATERLYSAIRATVARLAPHTLYDLYGGSGGIAMSCADLVQTVHSVEEVAAATVDGRAHARDNHIPNITFQTADVKRYLTDLHLTAGSFAPDSLVIVDPPRSGMHPKALSHLAGLRAPHLLYVSCNPKLLARELAALIPTYELCSLEAFDLFPHTPHVEVLAHLRLVPTP